MFRLQFREHSRLNLSVYLAITHILVVDPERPQVPQDPHDEP